MGIAIGNKRDYNEAIKCPIKGIDKCENFMYNVEQQNICSAYWGGYIMTDNEKELLNIINSHDDPAQALEIAIQTISAYLEQHESYQESSAVRFQALA